MDRNRLSRWLKPIAQVHPDEVRQTLVLAWYSFMILFGYYLLKPLREALMLSAFDAEIRSYAVALQTALLLLIMPFYGRLIRRVQLRRVLPLSLYFVAFCLLLFLLAHLAGRAVAAPFYIWLGMINVLLIAQFWALCADIHSVQAGKRVFAVIAAGATLGALVGALSSKLLLQQLGSAQLLLLAAITFGLLAALFNRLLPSPGEPQRTVESPPASFWSGLEQLWQSRYLMLVALFVLLLNTINSMGEFVLARWVQQAFADSSERVAQIGGFYGEFYAVVNLLTVLIQLFLVSRLIRWCQIGGALYIVPLFSLLGYSVVLLVPLFSLFVVYKAMENSLDYSLQNTLRHALFLPLSGHQLYEGKTFVDSVCWRLGDLLHAGMVWWLVGVWQWGISGVLATNLGLVVIWLLLSYLLARQHKRQSLTPASVRF